MISALTYRKYESSKPLSVLQRKSCSELDIPHVDRTLVCRTKPKRHEIEILLSISWRNSYHGLSSMSSSVTGTRVLGLLFERLCARNSTRESSARNISPSYQVTSRLLTLCRGFSRWRSAGAELSQPNACLSWVVPAYVPQRITFFRHEGSKAFSFFGRCSL